MANNDTPTTRIERQFNLSGNAQYIEHVDTLEQHFHAPTEITYEGKPHRKVSSPLLLTERQRKLLQKAEKDNLLSMDGEPWQTQLNPTQLDYLLGRIFCGDTPEWGDREEKHLWMHGGGTLPTDDLNRLFGRNNIGNARRSRKAKPVPQGHEKVDELF